MEGKRWQLLQYRNIARHASDKQIKKFVKSLDVTLLKRMIEMYTESVLSQLPREYAPLSPSKTFKQWKEPKHNGAELCTNDAQIFALLKQHCNNKRPSMYQQQSNLVHSVPMEIFAYSLSFLSFRQLSAIQRVCLYFMTSSRKYGNLSHYHLNIDRRFIDAVTSNQVNMDLLTHFKSIDITSVARVGAFKHMIQNIITHSQSSLQSLTVDCYYKSINDVVLYLIFNAAPSFPALRTVHWKRCSEYPWRRVSVVTQSHPWAFVVRQFEWDALVKAMQKRIPQLRHLEITTMNDDQMEGVMQSIVDNSIGSCLYNTLHSLYLTNNALFSTNIIPCILRKMKHLNDLHICTLGKHSLHSEITKDCISTDALDGNAQLILSKHTMSFMNESIRRLSLKFTVAISTTRITNLLMYFFIHCINITDLTLDFSACGPNMNIKWYLLFDLLMVQKARYANHDAQSLSTLTFTANQADCESIINGLRKVLSAHSKLQNLHQIHFQLPDWERSYQEYLNLEQWMHTTMNTLSIFEPLQAFSIQMPLRYKALNINWNCSVPKHVSYSDFYHHLTKLNLDHVDLFQCNLIPVVLRNIPTLSHLSVSTNIPSTETFGIDFKKEFMAPHQWEYEAIDILNQQQPSFHHPLLHTLKLNLSFEAKYHWRTYKRVSAYTMKAVNDNVAHILSYFYLICPHITDLTMDWLVTFMNDDQNITVPWKLLLDLFAANKRMHSAKPLSKLSVCGKQSMLNGLITSCNVSTDHTANLTHLKLAHIHFNETVMTFLKILTAKDCQLQSLHIAITNDTYEEYGECIMFLLQTMPKSLQYLSLNCTSWFHPKYPRKNRYDDMSWKIVKCLVKVSVNSELNIKDIDVNGLYVHQPAIKYLKFYFGFQNKLIWKRMHCKITLRE
eukprot:888099_1